MPCTPLTCPSPVEMLEEAARHRALARTGPTPRFHEGRARREAVDAVTS
jgi:hypothetical protein